MVMVRDSLRETFLVRNPIFLLFRSSANRSLTTSYRSHRVSLTGPEAADTSLSVVVMVVIVVLVIVLTIELVLYLPDVFLLFVLLVLSILTPVVDEAAHETEKNDEDDSQGDP